MSKFLLLYLAAVGGYPFTTEDRKNSVDVTMRRLAEQGFCEVQHGKGQVGNLYNVGRDKVWMLIQERRAEMLQAAAERGEGASSTKVRANIVHGKHVLLF